MHVRPRLRILLTGLCAFYLLTNGGVRVCEATPISFSDAFEGASIDPFWTLSTQNGSTQLSSDQAYSGVQSVQLTGTGGGQVEVSLSHLFSQTTGSLSVWFYDTAPGIYAGLYASDTSNPTNVFGVNVADWNSTNYIWHGPGVSETPTALSRSIGWHEFTLDITATGFTALIDGIVVGTVAGSFTFDTVRLLVSGPNETGTFYFDDFSVEAGETSPVPEPATLALMGIGLAGLAAKRRRRTRNRCC